MKNKGPDTHKNAQAGDRDENGKILGNERFRTDANDIGQFFKRITTDTDERSAVVMEAKGFYR